MEAVSKVTAVICFFLGVLGLSIAFEMQSSALGPFNFHLVMIEVFPLAIVLCTLPFLATKFFMRNLGNPSLFRSISVWFFTGAGGTATLLLPFAIGNTKQNIEPSSWLLCLYLGIAGIGVGIVLHCIEVAILKACFALKVDQNAA